MFVKAIRNYTRVKLPQFSIITMFYNEGKSIRGTFDSIYTQSFRDFEWIVVDGGFYG
ncbi:MAG: glycosyltransferase [Coraliomargaritaceae bacterium]